MGEGVPLDPEFPEEGVCMLRPRGREEPLWGGSGGRGLRAECKGPEATPINSVLIARLFWGSSNLSEAPLSRSCLCAVATRAVLRQPLCCHLGPGVRVLHWVVCVS